MNSEIGPNSNISDIMDKIVVCSATNRDDSMTLRMANWYVSQLRELGQEAHLLSLRDADVYSRSEAMLRLENELLIPASKFVFIVPEYNGSFPGILKLMLDNSDIKKCWWYKKALLTGIADGRAGNLRGLDHLTNILNYLRVQVWYNKIPVSRIREELSTEGALLKEATLQALKQQIDEFIRF